MKILGLNASPWLSVGHDASAAILVDGKLKFAIEEERLIRKRRAYDALPILSAKSCLETQNLTLDDIDCIVFDWDFEKVGLAEINYAISKKEIMERFFPKKYFKYTKVPEIRFVEHHLSHASATYRSSSFDKSAILVIDGQGEYCSTSIWLGENNSITRIWSNKIEESLGYMYGAIARYIGMRNGDEGKLMGLAPYGEVKEEIVSVLKSITPKIQKDDLKRKNGQQKIIVSQWINGLEEQLGHKDNLRTGFNKMSSYFSKNIEFSKFQKDLAASAQYFLEQKILELVDKAIELTNCKNICLSGGVTLNCIANQRIVESEKIDNLFVHPATNDAGCAIGAALQVSSETTECFSKNLDDPYLGFEYSDNEIKSELENFKLTYKHTKNPSKYAAQLLLKGNIIGWFQGRMEFGPRALGNRSVLALPAQKDMWLKVNIVKERESWRPLAPSVLSSSAKDFFTISNDFKYMIVGAQVKESIKEKVPSIVHIDGSSRPQSVYSELNQQYHNLIQKVGELTGTPLVLNTSFNGKGEPIVCSPRDAIKAFYGSGLDYLVIGSFILKK